MKLPFLLPLALTCLQLSAQRYNPRHIDEQRNMFHIVNPAYAHSIGVGATVTDKCITPRYSFVFYEYEGKLGRRLNNNGFYITAGKGVYPEWNLAGAKEHRKVSAGIMIGSPFDSRGWFPTINFGLSRNWYNTYPGYKIINQPVFYQWDFEFGSSANIGRYYSWVIVGCFRQLEMTIGFSYAFNL